MVSTGGTIGREFLNKQRFNRLGQCTLGVPF